MRIKARNAVFCYDYLRNYVIYYLQVVVLPPRRTHWWTTLQHLFEVTAECRPTQSPWPIMRTAVVAFSRGHFAYFLVSVIIFLYSN